MKPNREHHRFPSLRGAVSPAVLFLSMAFCSWSCFGSPHSLSFISAGSEQWPEAWLGWAGAVALLTTDHLLLFGHRCYITTSSLYPEPLFHPLLALCWETTISSCRITMENVKSFWVCQIRRGKGESPITEITFMRVSQDRHLTPLHHMVLLCNALNTEKEGRWQSKSRRGHQPLANRTMWSSVEMNMKEGIQPQAS